MRKALLLILSLASFCLSTASAPSDRVAPLGSYLGGLREGLNARWPQNRTQNLVFHGHSVPSGYFATPNVQTLAAYPHQMLEITKRHYPHAVVNSIVTAVGGEHSEQGAKRFDAEVLAHRADVLFIDYALNDRNIGLARAAAAWRKMIEGAMRRGIPVVLCTPTPDLNSDLLDPNTPLAQHARQIRALAAEYGIGLADTYAAFVRLAGEGREMRSYMSQSNHPNERGHAVAAGQIARWVLTDEQYRSFCAEQALTQMRRVADWQLDHFERQWVEGSRYKESHAYWSWVNATMYVGLEQMAGLVSDAKYRTFLQTIGRKTQWQVGRNIFFADDICVGQFYAMAYDRARDSAMLSPTLAALDRIMTTPNDASLSYYAKGSHSRWCWCDAIFMGPTTFARVGKVTGNRSYFDYLDRELQTTCDSLYCPDERLFFRDTRYINMREKNGERVFWGRGNGWVTAGLTILIDNLPDDHAAKERYTKLFCDMISRVAELQGKNGFWHASMLDPEAYPSPESSATGFFTYSLLWGINRGLLDREQYGEAAEKGWSSLCSAVHADGKLGYVQPIGADPQQVGKEDTEVYGTGAFLLAGTQMYHYLKSKGFAAGR